jgi:hypothetical protein
VKPSIVEIGAKLAFDALVKAALTKFLAALPKFFGGGPIGAIISHYVLKYADLLFSELKDFVRIELIIFKNEQAQKEHAAKSIELHRIAIEKGIDSDEFKKQNEIETAALSQFVRFGRFRSVQQG